MAADTSRPQGDMGWVERELTRLETNKAEKGYVKGLERMIEELRKSLDKDITGIQSTVGDAKKLAEDHPCSQEERLASMDRAISFWNAWFVRGLVGFITFLLTIGGLWLWSYFDLSAAVAGTKKASLEDNAAIQTTVNEIKATQAKQEATLQRIEEKDATAQQLNVDVIKTAVKEALKSR